MALCTLSDVKTVLGVTDTSEDTLLNLLITWASNAIEEYCDRVFGTATYTEFYSGSGTPYLTLNQRPVTSITSVYLDNGAYWGSASGAFGSSTLLTAGTDYALVKDQANGSSRCGLLYRINGCWDRPLSYSPGLIAPFDGPATGNAKVVYVGGYATVPTNVALACQLAVASVRQMAQYGQALQSEGYEEYSYTLVAAARRHVLSPEVRSMLARYRNVAVA